MPKPSKPKPSRAIVAGSAAWVTLTSSRKLPTVPVKGVTEVNEMVVVLLLAWKVLLNTDQPFVV